MARHGGHFSSSRSRKTSRKVENATIGTHVERQGGAPRSAAQRKPASYSNARVASRASESHLDTLMPTATSGEDAASYRRRSQQRRYVESLQRKARIRRIVTALLAVLVVAAVALGAGWLAFRGVLGSQMMLRDSNAAEALSAPKSDETVYTLVTAELGEVAEPLAKAGPDMILLVVENRESGKLAILNIPSSLKVTVDNDTRRLADMAADGDASLISAVESYTKLDIHHFVKVPEGGMAGIVDALGGIDVTFEQEIDDPHAGDVYYPVGTYTVNGPGAVTYLRANNIKMGETDQMKNQAAFAKAILARLVTSERGFTTELEAIDEFFQTDLSLGNLEDFARWVNEIGVENVRTDIVPGYFTTSSDIVGENSTMFVSKSAEFAEFIEGLGGSSGDGSQEAATQVADPTTFNIEVRNGTDIAGAGKTTAEALANQGFRITDVGNAEQQVYDETLVIYRTSNTPKPEKKQEVALDEEGNPIEGAADGAEGAEGAMTEQTGEEAGEGTGQAASAASQQMSKEEALAAERETGVSRANAVINALGIGRAVEGDMYYSFDADVLLIIGYDYKPVV